MTVNREIVRRAKAIGVKKTNVQSFSRQLDDLERRLNKTWGRLTNIDYLHEKKRRMEDLTSLDAAIAFQEIYADFSYLYNTGLKLARQVDPSWEGVGEGALNRSLSSFSVGMSKSRDAARKFQVRSKYPLDWRIVRSYKSKAMQSCEAGAAHLSVAKRNLKKVRR